MPGIHHVIARTIKDLFCRYKTLKGFKVNPAEFTFHHRLLDKNFANEYNQSFDICLCFHVLEHVYDIKDFIKNLFSITKSGGTIILE